MLALVVFLNANKHEHLQIYWWATKEAVFILRRNTDWVVVIKLLCDISLL